MTDKEIIKALEYILKNFDGRVVDFMAISSAIDLINRQQAEIERLSKKNEELAEILSDTIRIRYAEAKTEAIKDFVHEIFSPFKDKAYLSKRDLEIIVNNLAKYYEQPCKRNGG